ncbi:unnamed protein product, partial [Pylaiella littoralis]
DGEPSWRRHRCVVWHPYLQAGAGQLTSCEAREVIMVTTTLVGGGLQRAMVVCNSARRVVMLVPRARSTKGTNNGSNSGMTISSRLLLCPLSTATRPAAEASGDETKEGSEAVHRPVRDIVVVGAGVAGLASAACLARIGLRVTIAEIRGQDRWGHDREERGARVGVGGTAAGKRAKHKEPAALEKNGVSNTRDDAIDPGVGIWTHGLACLDELGILQQLEAEGRYMGEAGYRSACGNWLATPSQPLGEYASRDEAGANGGESRDGALFGGGGGGAGDNSASVLFVRESKLIEALQSALPDNTRFVQARVEDIARASGSGKGGGVCSGRGTAAGRFCAAAAATTSIGPAGSRTGSSSSSSSGIDKGGDSGGGRWTQEFDLLVGADGPESFVRDMVMVMSSPGPATPAAAGAGAEEGAGINRGGVSSAAARSEESGGGGAAVA